MFNEHNKNLVLVIIAIILLALLALTGCAKIEVTPPDARPDTPRNHALPVAYDRLWARTIGWFDVHEVEITEINERFGLVSGVLHLQEGDGQLDCGTFHITTALSQPKLSREAHIRVQLNGAVLARPQVLVAVTGAYKLDVIDNYAAQTIRKTGPCVSRGVLENEIVSFLAG